MNGITLAEDKDRCEHDNEFTNPVKDGGFDQLSDCQLLKNNILQLQFGN